MADGNTPQNRQVVPANQHPPAPVRQPVPQVPVEMQRAYDLVNALWNDADVGAKIRSTAKARYNIQLPDDAIDPVVAPLRKQVEELSKSLAEEREAKKKRDDEEAEAKQRQKIEDTIHSARQKYRLTQEGFEKMIKRMQDAQNYTDAEAAAAWVVSNEPPPTTPIPAWAPKSLDMKGNLDAEMVKLLHSDPRGYEDAQLTEFFKDPDKYTRETIGSS